jgi:hypothetical protein
VEPPSDAHPGGQDTPPGPEPGERPRRVLDHAPAERYAAAASAAEARASAADQPARRAARGAGVALVGSLAIAILGGPFSTTAGLVVVAAVIGWLVGSVVRPAVGLAVTIAVASVVVGLIGVWIYARLEGGVLGLTDYLGEVQGVLVPIQLLLAGGVAAATIR